MDDRHTVTALVRAAAKGYEHAWNKMVEQYLSLGPFRHPLIQTVGLRQRLSGSSGFVCQCLSDRDHPSPKE